MHPSQRLQIEDLTEKQRVGIKGAQAERWLNQQVIATPPLPNHWLETYQANGQTLLVLRLGTSEFLIEALDDQTDVPLTTFNQVKAAGVYTVPRADASFRLAGENINALLAQICMLDITQALQENALVMTQIAGVSAILLKESTQQNSYRLCCDVSYKHYLQDTLKRLAAPMDIEPKR